ncbi:universal stress protein [Labrys wisconsinensis]|uniref:Nucleotide-binding universal stress UspA family protein n=1 Tax=Labrys wisconsinensis TaxID=425677 RepID=A0ABU0J6D7_9HYPH|nr:universal stress protein [Labrys wisconsinensis]MDQ0469824.1 nucleotide-binding universal stress UspA family protein [Labrys wisconsinensis]
MPCRCILVPTGPGIDAGHRLEAAVRLAGRTHAHVEVLFVRPDAKVLYASLPEVLQAAGVTAESIERDNIESASRACATLEAWCAARDLPMSPDDRLDATFASWREAIGEVSTIVAAAGRVSDLIVVDRPLWTDPFVVEAFDAAVFASGRPTLVVGDRVPDDLLRHVMIAWNGSLEGARAVAQAMPLLQEAAHVTIFTAPGAQPARADLSDLGQYLRWHGVVARPAVAAPDDAVPVGEALLTVCSQENASLLVMGAYTHSRLRQLLLGGVTRHVLDHAPMPVLMAH